MSKKMPVWLMKQNRGNDKRPEDFLENIEVQPVLVEQIWGQTLVTLINAVNKVSKKEFKKHMGKNLKTNSMATILTTLS